jgi:hypothetical protein
MSLLGYYAKISSSCGRVAHPFSIYDFPLSNPLGVPSLNRRFDSRVGEHEPSFPFLRVPHASSAMRARRGGAEDLGNHEPPRPLAFAQKSSPDFADYFPGKLTMDYVILTSEVHGLYQRGTPEFL